MGGWALGLALLFFVPLLPLVGLILGIVVLLRGRDGRDHGKGLAIAAIVAGAAAMLLQVIVFAAGFVEGIVEGSDGTTRDSSGEVVEGGELAPLKLRTGDCFDDQTLSEATGDETIEAETVQAVPCSEPHSFEVFATFDIAGPDDDFPGEAAIDEELRRCLPEFAAFVGRPYAKSDLEVSFYFPTSASWRLVGDRAITCVVWDPHDERLTGSLQNSKR